MKITVLGSGAAGGVPMISVGWGACDPNNPKNRRRRPSVLVETKGLTILIDAGPDLREQLLATGTQRLDAVLFTHGHADHTHGIDDLREINRAMMGPIQAYGTEATLDDIASRFGYVFGSLDLDTMPVYKPWLVRNVIKDDGSAFEIGGLSIKAFDQDHGYGRSTGFRFGDFAYSTDVWDMPENSFAQLEGLDLWIVGCLLDRPHTTHAHVDKVIGWVERLRPKRTLLTHMSPRMDYASLCASLPKGIEPAYDGQTLLCPDP